MVFKSLKIIKINTRQKHIYDFLLVFHYKNMPIFYHFRDTTNYWSKICIFSSFLVFSTIILFKSLAKEFPGDLWYESWYKNLKFLSYTLLKTCDPVSIYLHKVSACD